MRPHNQTRTTGANANGTTPGVSTTAAASAAAVGVCDNQQGHIVHPVAVRANIPLKTEVREKHKKRNSNSNNNNHQHHSNKKKPSQVASKAAKKMRSASKPLSLFGRQMRSKTQRPATGTAVSTKEKVQSWLERENPVCEQIDSDNESHFPDDGRNATTAATAATAAGRSTSVSAQVLTRNSCSLSDLQQSAGAAVPKSSVADLAGRFSSSGNLALLGDVPHNHNNHKHHQAGRRGAPSSSSNSKMMRSISEYQAGGSQQHQPKAHAAPRPNSRYVRSVSHDTQLRVLSRHTPKTESHSRLLPSQSELELDFGAGKGSPLSLDDGAPIRPSYQRRDGNETAAQLAAGNRSNRSKSEQQLDVVGLVPIELTSDGHQPSAASSNSRFKSIDPPVRQTGTEDTAAAAIDDTNNTVTHPTANVTMIPLKANMPKSSTDGKITSNSSDNNKRNNSSITNSGHSNNRFASFEFLNFVVGRKSDAKVKPDVAVAAAGRPRTAATAAVQRKDGDNLKVRAKALGLGPVKVVLKWHGANRLKPKRSGVAKVTDKKAAAVAATAAAPRKRVIVYSNGNSNSVATKSDPSRHVNETKKVYQVHQVASKPAAAAAAAAAAVAAAAMEPETFVKSPANVTNITSNPLDELFVKPSAPLDVHNQQEARVKLRPAASEPFAAAAAAAAAVDSNPVDYRSRRLSVQERSSQAPMLSRHLSEMHRTPRDQRVTASNVTAVDVAALALAKKRHRHSWSIPDSAVPAPVLPPSARQSTERVNSSSASVSVQLDLEGFSR